MFGPQNPGPGSGYSEFDPLEFSFIRFWSNKNMGVQQRGLICTENKPLGRLCKMCNLFFHEFRFIPPANRFQLDCDTSTDSPQRLKTRELTLIGVLPTLATEEGQVAKGQEQASWAESAELWATVPLIPAAGKWNMHSSHDRHSKIVNGMHGQYSSLVLTVSLVITHNTLIRAFTLWWSELRNSLWYGLHLGKDDLNAYALYLSILFGVQKTR